MELLDLARVLIYRVHEKGLEVFLIEPDLDEDPEVWKLPAGISPSNIDKNERSFIHLNSEKLSEDGIVATEGDWHDIPSIRGIIKHDLKRAKRKVKAYLPDMNRGKYFSVNDVSKFVIPQEHAAISELDEILKERNLLLNI